MPYKMTEPFKVPNLMTRKQIAYVYGVTLETIHKCLAKDKERFIFFSQDKKPLIRKHSLEVMEYLEQEYGFEKINPV